MKMNDLYASIEAKYGFAIPEEYRRMERLGWFDPKNRDTYLWIFETEWLRPEEILEYEPLEHYKPGFVPFAFDGGGSHWCWWPAEGVVVYCPHDYELGEVDAPDLLSSMYRRTLEYAAGGFEQDEETEARAYLKDWAERLNTFFPSAWISTLNEIAAAPLIQWKENVFTVWGFLHPDLMKEVFDRDLIFPRMGKKFQWMHPYNSSPA